MRQARHTDRSGLVYYLEVRDDTSGRPVGRLGDISPLGLRVVGESIPLEPEQHYRLRIVCPADTFPGGDVVVEAVCRWRGSDVNPAFQAAGLVFRNVSSEVSLRLNDLIRSLGLAT